MAESKVIQHIKDVVAAFMGKYNLIIIGGGPAGLSAAISAYDKGERSILILERENRLGGVLNSCVQDGFGLDVFGESLSGREFVTRLVKKIEDRKIAYKLNTSVLSISKQKEIKAVSPDGGMMTLEAKCIVYTLGAREMPRGSLNIPGSRPIKGIYSAGSLQKLLDENASIDCKNVIILGSDDVGLSTANRLVKMGVSIKAIVEPKPYIYGSFYNKEKSIDNNNIPLLLSHTITEIIGKTALEKVRIKDLTMNEESEKTIDIDTLVISVGLVPECSLLEDLGITMSEKTFGPIVNEHYETSIDGIFVSGNALFVHDIVDHITKEGEQVGTYAYEYINNAKKRVYDESKNIQIEYGENIVAVVPQLLNIDNLPEIVPLYFRVKNALNNVSVSVYLDEKKYIEITRSVMTPNVVYSIPLYREDLRCNPRILRLFCEVTL